MGTECGNDDAVVLWEQDCIVSDLRQEETFLGYYVCAGHSKVCGRGIHIRNSKKEVKQAGRS